MPCIITRRAMIGYNKGGGVAGASKNRFFLVVYFYLRHIKEPYVGCLLHHMVVCIIFNIMKTNHSILKTTFIKKKRISNIITRVICNKLNKYITYTYMHVNGVIINVWVYYNYITNRYINNYC